MTEVLILLGSFVLLCMLGMPVAYTLGLAAIVGALWIDVPLEAVMIQISSGVNSFSLLAIPFFVLAGAIMRARPDLLQCPDELLVAELIQRRIDMVRAPVDVPEQAEELGAKRP